MNAINTSTGETERTNHFWWQYLKKIYERKLEPEAEKLEGMGTVKTCTQQSQEQQERSEGQRKTEQRQGGEATRGQEAQESLWSKEVMWARGALVFESVSLKRSGWMDRRSWQPPQTTPQAVLVA